MEIHILTEYNLKMSMIGDDIAKNVISAQIWSIFVPTLAKMLFKMAKCGRIANLYDLKHGNTGTDQVSAKN